LSSLPPRPTLSDARAKLRNLGYLESRVERFVFRRALQGIAVLLLPVVFAGALAITLAQTGAVAASQFRYGQSPRAVALLFVHLFLPAVLPSAVFAAALFFAAGRSGRPGRGAAVFGLLASAGALVLWTFGTLRLGPERASTALVWGIPVSLASLLFGATARATFLARAFAQSGRLPEHPRRAILLFAVAGAFSIAAVLFAMRREPAHPAPPLPARRSEAVVVVGIDGLALDSPCARDEPIARRLSGGSTGWWETHPASPAEIWTDLSTGVPATRHGVRALEWIRPLGVPALRPPWGTSWYLRGVGLAVGTVSRSPVSAWERRSLAFWEVAASAGLPALAVGWWASGRWPGATIVENREVLAQSANGIDADSVAIREFERRFERQPVAALYLPGADILRGDPPARAAALARLAPFLDRWIARARLGEVALVVLAADSHPPPGSHDRIVVFDGGTVPSAGIRSIRPVDVAPSVLARAGIPVARDLPGRAIAALFRPGSLDTTAVATYGERVAPAAAARPETDREYLEKLKSLGYLN
jgi:hypothetical protein